MILVALAIIVPAAPDLIFERFDAPVAEQRRSRRRSARARSTGGYGSAAALRAPEGAYYRNCSEARAAGVTPLRRGMPGYAPKLDRDGDGVACE